MKQARSELAVISPRLSSIDSKVYRDVALAARKRPNVHCAGYRRISVRFMPRNGAEAGSGQMMSELDSAEKGRGNCAGFA